MSSTGPRSGESKLKTRRKSSSFSPFDELALEYDAWFDGEGSLIFFNKVQAFRRLLPTLPKPWLEIGVGSGRFAQALGIETGIDPSGKLVEIAKSRGINAFLGRGEEEIFDKESFGTVFLIVTLCFLDSPLDVLKEANRILMPDGIIYGQAEINQDQCNRCRLCVEVCPRGAIVELAPVSEDKLEATVSSLKHRANELIERIERLRKTAKVKL